MDMYRLISKKDHWVLINDQTGIVEAVYRNRTKGEAIVMLEKRFRNAVCQAAVYGACGKREHLLHFPRHLAAVSVRSVDRVYRLAHVRVVSQGDGVKIERRKTES